MQVNALTATTLMLTTQLVILSTALVTLGTLEMAVFVQLVALPVMLAMRPCALRVTTAQLCLMQQAPKTASASPGTGEMAPTAHHAAQAAVPAIQHNACNVLMQTLSPIPATRKTVSAILSSSLTLQAFAKLAVLVVKPAMQVTVLRATMLVLISQPVMLSTALVKTDTSKTELIA
jgi:hypothetical protein